MASSSSPLLFVGQQCSDEHCYLVDFLPFKCQHCSKSYCGEHFKPADHQCEKYDASKHDRVAPSCPICNQPVAIPLGQDPNIKMTNHIERECGKGREEVSKVPRCANGKCHKVLYAPIKCDTCRQQFCAEHRFPTTHKCTTQPAISTKPPMRQPMSTSNEPNVSVKIKQAADTGSAKTAAGMAALKRAMASTRTAPAPASNEAAKHPPSTAPQIPATSAKKTSAHTNPFSKSDRWVPNPLESSVSAHSRSTPPPSPTTSSPTTTITNHSQPPQPCKSDAMSALLTTSYHPPPLFAH